MEIMDSFHNKVDCENNFPRVAGVTVTFQNKDNGMVGLMKTGPVSNL